MANNKIQLKRTSITGRTPNTTNSGNTSFIDAGELAVNLTDQKVFSSNGTVSFEVGSNLTSLSVGSIVANGTTGTSGQSLISNGSAIYWSNNAGYTGSAGFTGSQGAAGFTGSAGTNGATGFTGSKGTTTISNTAPASPVNGDTWWNSETGVRYVYYADGTSNQWVQESAAGTTGFTGSAGSLGYTGSAGFTGSAGSLGYTGSAGATGFTGSASTVAGPTGFTGSAGSLGYTGSAGVTGFTGSASTVAGPTGFTGSAGAGFTGSTGSQGPIGYTGSSGGGGGSVGGSNTQIQFNDSGSSNGAANFTYDKTNKALSFSGNTVNFTVNSTGSATGGITFSAANTGITLSAANTVLVNAQSLFLENTPIKFYNAGGGTLRGSINSNSESFSFTSTQNDFLFYNGPEVFRISGNNRVFVGGSDTNFNERLQVNGAIRMVSGNGVWFADGTQQTTAAVGIPGAVYNGNTVVVGNSSTTSIIANTNSVLPYTIQSVNAANNGYRYDYGYNTTRQILSSITYHMPPSVTHYGGNSALDFSRSVVRFDLSGNITFTLSNVPSAVSNAGQFILLIIDPGNGYSVTWPTVQWIGNSAPTLDNYYDNLIVLFYDSADYNSLTGCYIGSTA